MGEGDGVGGVERAPFDAGVERELVGEERGGGHGAEQVVPDVLHQRVQVEPIDGTIGLEEFRVPLLPVLLRGPEVVTETPKHIPLLHSTLPGSGVLGKTARWRRNECIRKWCGMVSDALGAMASPKVPFLNTERTTRIASSEKVSSGSSTGSSPASKREINNRANRTLL
eukprot:6325171-Pyramimonas_sp.AAC.1